MTSVENERLGILETEVKQIKFDVSEIKTNVRVLLDAYNLALALRSAEKARSSTFGTWFRFAMERSVAFVALFVALLSVLRV